MFDDVQGLTDNFVEIVQCEGLQCEIIVSYTLEASAIGQVRSACTTDFNSSKCVYRATPHQHITCLDADPNRDIRSCHLFIKDLQIWHLVDEDAVGSLASLHEEVIHLALCPEAARTPHSLVDHLLTNPQAARNSARTSDPSTPMATNKACGV